MKLFLSSFAVVAMLAIAGCSDTSVSTDPNSDQESGSLAAWSAPNGVTLDYSGSGWSPKSGATIADDGKPLTILNFSELPFQPVNGLSYNGVSFTYTVGGVGSGDARYNAGGPNPGPYIQPPVLEGGTTGVLTITFDQPTDVVEFGLALSTGATLPVGATVDVIAPSGKSRGVFDVATAPAPNFSGAQFSYGKNAVKSIVITFNSTAALRFAIDNLTYHQGAND